MKALILLALCAFTAAMVPIEKRAVDSEQSTSATAASSTMTSSATQTPVCQPHTPCAWSMYKPIIKIIENVVTNNYCVCSADTVCVIDEEDIMSSAYVHRCRPAGSEPADLDIGTR